MWSPYSLDAPWYTEQLLSILQCRSTWILVVAPAAMEQWWWPYEPNLSMLLWLTTWHFVSCGHSAPGISGLLPSLSCGDLSNLPSQCHILHSGSAGLLVWQHSAHHPLAQHRALLGALQPSQASLTSQILLPKQTSASPFPSSPPAPPSPNPSTHPGCWQRGCRTRVGRTFSTHDPVSQVFRVLSCSSYSCPCKTVRNVPFFKMSSVFLQALGAFITSELTTMLFIHFFIYSFTWSIYFWGLELDDH